MMQLADKILTLRKQNGLSQEELAEKLNVSRQAVSRWEVGSSQPDASNILQLSKLFGVTADYLLNDAYESDQDVPMVKRTKAAAQSKFRYRIAICISTLGLFFNMVIYVLSRFIKVMIPHPVYDNGQIIFYEYSSEYTAYSYKYFIQEHHMEFLVFLFGVMFLSGIIYLLLQNHTIQKHLNICKEKRRKKAVDP